MKLIRFGKPGRELPGIVLDSGQRKDLATYFSDWDHDFFQNDGLTILANLIEEEGYALDNVPEDERLGSPVARPGKVVCVGLNYKDHATESAMELPDEPVLFFKAPNTVVGPYDPIIIPPGSQKTDWEIELGVIIAKDACRLESAEDAADYIAGYCICNDVSEREYQLEHCGQWVKGKSCDSFNPTGPYLVTKDEIGLPTNLDMRLEVNGEQRQAGNTKDMAFSPYELVHYISQFMTLEAGDLINTGTPAGVGLGMDPPTYLKAGDVVELEIVGLGRQRQVCADA